MIFAKRALVALAALGLLGACGQNEPPAEAPPEAPAIATPFGFFKVESFHDAAVTASNTTFIVARSGDERQGLQLKPAEEQDPAPVRIDFTVEGAGAQVSVYRGGEWYDLPQQASYQIRLGPGGAYNILIVPAANSQATVSVTGTTTCRGQPEDTCPPLPIPAQ